MKKKDKLFKKYELICNKINELNEQGMHEVPVVNFVIANNIGKVAALVGLVKASQNKKDEKKYIKQLDEAINTLVPMLRTAQESFDYVMKDKIKHKKEANND